MKRICTLILFSISITMLASETAEEIVRKSLDHSSPSTSQADARLLLIDSKNLRKERSIRVSYLDLTEKSSTLVEFRSPADVAGTKFLSSTEGGETTQRIYLPASKRTRLITGSSKGSSFMGTDFSYYDLEDTQFEDFSYELLEEDAVIQDKAFEGKTFFRIKATPREDNPYAYIVWWIASDNFFSYRSDCYDAAGSKVKEILVLKLDEEDGYLLPSVVFASTLADSHKTFWLVEKRTLNIELDDALFNPASLR